MKKRVQKYCELDVNHVTNKFTYVPNMNIHVIFFKAFNRDLTKYEQRLAYYRDTRLTGNPYAQQVDSATDR